jgi:hypothetical protein
MKATINTINGEQSLLMNRQMLYHFGQDALNSMPKHTFEERYNELCSYLFDRAYLPNENVVFNPHGVDIRWNGEFFETIYQ